MVPDGKLQKGQRNYAGRQTTCAASYDRSFILTKGLAAGGFFFWNENREAKNARVWGGYDYVLAVGPAGKFIASANDNNEIMITETTNWQPTDDRFQLLFDDIAGAKKTTLRALAFSPDGTKLAYATTNGQIAALDIETGTEEIYVEKNGYSVSALYWCSDEIVAVRSNTVVFVKPGTQQEEEPFELANLPIEPDLFSVTQDGALMLIASRDKKHAAIVDLVGKTIKHEFRGTKQQL